MVDARGVGSGGRSEDPAPTIYDIGRRAGVAASTVSKVLGRRSASYPIAAETRERILDAARALGYELDPAQRLRRGRKTGVIGVIYGTDTPLSHGVYEPLADHLGHVAAAAGYRLEFYPAITWEDQREVLNLHPMDGCLLVPYLPVEDPDPRAPLLVPTVVLNDLTALAVPHVVTDDAQGMVQLVEHLLGLGHRTILYADIADRPRCHSSEAVRRRAFTDRVAAAGLPVHQIRGEPSAVLDAARQRSATAIITYNNQLALALIPELRSRRISLPRDLSLACATDVPLATLLDPGLTALRIPMRDMAGKAFDELQAMIDGSARLERRMHIVPQTMIVRGSTAPPSGGPTGRH